MTQDLFLKMSSFERPSILIKNLYQYYSLNELGKTDFKLQCPECTVI